MKKSFIFYRDSERFDRKLRLDEGTADVILDFLEDETIKRKFDYIVDWVLEQPNRFYKDYERIKNYKDLTEFRLFPNGLNARIYCKEVKSSNGGIFVIAIVLIPKKRDVDKSIVAKWKAISKYEYDVDK